jgi:enoyl-CoA hydratase
VEFEELLSACREDVEIGVLIVAGAGEKAFVAGADITELGDLGEADGREFSKRGQRLFDVLEMFPKPVIAAVNGFCLGGGCELALACHIRIASETAVFGLPETKLGLIPGYGGTQRMARTVGRGWATQLILTADMINASQALQIGLVNEVVPKAELTRRCRELAAKILGKGPLAIRLALEAINRGVDMPLKEGLALEASLFGLACASDDLKEGTRAFLEKRPANFKGK